MPTPPPQSAPPVSERQAWKAMAALSLGFFLSLLDQSMIAVVLPAIQSGFSATTFEVMWVPSVYLLAVVIPLMFTGRLGDIYGQRRMFRLGIGLFGLGALACSVAPTIELLIAARVLQGVGAAIQMPQTMSVINRVFARDRRGRALGVWGIIGSVAGLAGPLLGGILVGALGWHSVFWIHLPFVALALVLAGMWVPKLPTVARKIDYLSAVVSLLAMGAVVSAVQLGPKTGWAWWAWVLLAGGIVSVGVFVRLQATAGRRGTEALIPLKLFADRNYSLGAFSVSTLGFMAASMMLPIMVWLQSAQGLDANQAGVVMAPMAAVSMVLTPLAGVLVDRLHPRMLSQLGFTAAIAAFVLTWWIMAREYSPWWLMAALGLLGVGQSFIWGTNSATSMRDVPADLMGAASGVYNTTRQAGSVVGVALMSAAMQLGESSLGLARGMAYSLLLVVAVLLSGLVAVSFFRDTLHGAWKGLDNRTRSGGKS